MVRHSRHSAMDRASDRRRILQIMGLGAVGLATGHWSVLADDKAASLAEATASSTKTSETKLAAKATASTSSVPKGDKPSGLLAEPADVTQSEISDLAQARRLIADAREQMEQVKDYVCTFVKQERIGSKLLTPQVIQMKGRTEPHCIYFSFQTTHKGREAIYFPAKYSNNLVAHEGGWTGYLAGTMNLEPTGRLAMSDNRHPVTEAGINKLVTRVYNSWHRDLQPEHDVSIERGVTIGNRSTTMVQTKHDHRQPEFHYHIVRLYFDDELRLPVRFTGFEWPTRKGDAPPIVEDYQFQNLKVNVGLSDRDFDPSNPSYSYKR